MKRVRLEPEERRSALVAAALRLLARRPTRALTPEDVTKEAKVSRALFYRYFPSMEALELATLKNVAERLPFLPPPDASLRDQVAQAITSFFDFATMLKGPAIALLGAGSRPSPKAHALLETGRTRIVALMCERAQVAAPSPFVLLTLHAWLGVVERTTARWLVAPSVPRAELEAWLVDELEAMLEPVRRRERLAIAWSAPAVSTSRSGPPCRSPRR